MPRAFVEEFVRDFLAASENNNLGPGAIGKAWDGFILGFSSGADELYGFWKEHIGGFHWTPEEAFALGAGPGAPPAGADELTVISFALTQTEQTKAANRVQTRFPSEPWARTRIFGQANSAALHKALAAALTAHGYPAVAPLLLREWAEAESPSLGMACTWSERHVAYTSGLGTFGFCGGLITEKGKAVRLGSVIVRASIPVTPRPYSEPFAYCLYYTAEGCTSCIDRCPVGSVSDEGRDKRACARHLRPGTQEFVKREYGFDGYGCGLCQTDVPCESGIPAALRG